MEMVLCPGERTSSERERRGCECVSKQRARRYLTAGGGGEMGGCGGGATKTASWAMSSSEGGMLGSGVPR